MMSAFEICDKYRKTVKSTSFKFLLLIEVLSLSFTVIKTLLSRVKSHLKWIFSHAIKPKKYTTAPQGMVKVPGYCQAQVTVQVG